MNFTDFTKIDTINFSDKIFDCVCGNKHIVKTKKIIIGVNALVMLKDELFKIMPAGKVLFLSCEDIMNVYGMRIYNTLKGAGYNIVKHIFAKNVKPDIALASELLKYSEDIRLVIAYGSGCICDIAKHYSSLTGNKLVMIPSAPSNDGYLSSFSSLYVNGIKQNIITEPPYLLICDLFLMDKAPNYMKAAGFGEICSKLTVLCDWYFEKCITGSHYCENIAKLLKQSIDICMEEGEGLIAKKDISTYMLTDALLRCSLCMQLLGNDACSFGGEHHIADILNPIKTNGQKLLYGEKVFLTHKYIAGLYKLFFENKYSDLLPPVDKAIHAQKLAQITNTDYFNALSKMNYDLSVQSYKLKCYKTEEFRNDLTNMLQSTFINSNKASIIFKRMYNDAGYWINGIIKDRELTSAVALASDLSNRYTILAHMRNAGLFEKYLK